MAAYVDLGSVRTWYDVQGEGEPLVLLHPALTDSRAFGPNLPALASAFRCYTPERRGHGRTPDAGEMSYAAMADDTVRFLEKVVGGPARLLGCSDGAVVALHVALRRPDLVPRLAFVAGVFHRDGWQPGVLEGETDPPEFLADSYGELSPDGRDHFRVVVGKLARMHREEPTLSAAELAGIRCRTLVMVGDDDEVRLEHALELYRSVADAELAIVPGTSHGLLVEKPELCNRILLDFLAGEPVPTFAPIRRAGRDD
jgi:pimeloyl-ACP methyl ester carboxylesterase